MKDEFREVLVEFSKNAKLNLSDFIDHYIYWASPHLENEKSRREEVVFRTLFDSAEQKNAEKSIVQFLKSYEPDHVIRKRIKTNHPMRQTDWARTHTSKISGNLTIYHGNKKYVQSDPALIGSLLGVVGRWIRWLEKFNVENGEFRLKELKATFAKFNIQPRYWSPIAEKKLSLTSKSTYLKLMAARNIFERQICRNRNLIAIASKHLDKAFGSTQEINQNHLFEWLITLKISNIAISSGWKIKNSINHSNLREKEIIMESNSTALKIYKGKPIAHINYRDECRNILISHGIKSSGFEPDIVLNFYNKENINKSTYFIVDAKNNFTADGLDYMAASIKAGYTYAKAFQEILKHNPKCTLILRQFSETIASNAFGFNNLDEKCNDVSGLEVLCLEYRNFHPPGISPQDSVLEPSWFNLITKKACDYLASP